MSTAPLGGPATTFDFVVSAVERATGFTGHRRTKNNGIQTRCPVPTHGRGRGDRNPSLAVTPAVDRVLLHCDTGCHTDDVLASIGLTMSDLFDEPLRRADRPVAAVPPVPGPPRVPDSHRAAEAPPHGPWVYTDEDGIPLYRVAREEEDGSKSFKLYRPTKGGGWMLGISGFGITAHPYNWPRVLRGIQAGETIYITEGEKAAQALIDAGVSTATTAHGGAGKFSTHCRRHAPHFRDARVVVLPDNDEPGRRHADDVVATLADVAGQIAVLDLPGLPEKGDVYDWLAAGGTVTELTALAEKALKPAPNYTVTTLADVTPERVEWLWEGRLPAGKLTVVDGDPGVGKSTLALGIAATISVGGRWFDGSQAPLGDVLLLSGEDGLADTVRPRLDAAGADSTRIHALTGVRFLHEDGVRGERDPDLGDISAIEAAIRANNVRLVIVDVLMAFLPRGVDSHKDQDVRAVLRRLKDLAEQTGAAVLLLRHLNKGGSNTALYRGGGSIGIVGAARMGYLAVKDPDDPARVILAATKCNVAELPTSVAYRLTGTDNGAARVEWLEETDHTADDLTGQRGLGDAEERDAASEFLTDYIRQHGGEAGAKEATDALIAAFGPMSKPTIKRLRDRAGIRTRKSTMTGGWLWVLNGDEGFTKVPKVPYLGSVKPSEPSGDVMEPSGLGPCVSCGAPTQRYGAGASPRCHPCADTPDPWAQ